MNTNTENLMKHFASVLRNRALGKEKTPNISEQNDRYLSRKQLIEIIKRRFNGSIPKELNLVEMENTELLQVIEDDMYVLAYLSEIWSKELAVKSIAKLIPSNIKKEVSSTQNTKQDGKVSK